MPRTRKIKPYVSPDVREKYAAMAPPTAALSTVVALHVPVKVLADASEPILIEALMRSPAWHDSIKPRIDVGKFVIGKCDSGFLEEFYEMVDGLELEGFSKLVKKHVIKE